MTRTTISLAASSLFAGLFAGCANYATFQEADTLPQGGTRKGVAATYTNYSIESGDTTETVSVPALDLWYRYGITDRLEAHTSAWLPLGASAGAKYQVLGSRAESGLAVSLGLDLGVLQITSKDDQDMETKATIVDTYVPVYVGYRMGPSFASYLSPKYILRLGFGESTAVEHLAGGTLGLAIGDGTSLLLEGSLMYDITLGSPALQGGVGLAF